ncbi:uncharacterized protein LOC143846192 [Tasmannia lanceolata]|uniref:uncharacterized protein LOC143846192 n=1 Tax=Tasmannia lanceolata TaxID=3420 RepID=UPI004062A4EE
MVFPKTLARHSTTPQKNPPPNPSFPLLQTPNPTKTRPKHFPLQNPATTDSSDRRQGSPPTQNLGNRLLGFPDNGIAPQFLPDQCIYIEEMSANTKAIVWRITSSHFFFQFIFRNREMIFSPLVSILAFFPYIFHFYDPIKLSLNPGESISRIDFSFCSTRNPHDIKHGCEHKHEVGRGSEFHREIVSWFCFEELGTFLGIAPVEIVGLCKPLNGVLDSMAKKSQVIPV